MLTVHHLGVSQSERILWLCEELGLPYETIRYDRLPTGMAPPEYAALHPMGQAPVVADDGMVLAESGAIIEYMLARYGEGRLTVTLGQPGYNDYLFWFHYANATMLPGEMSRLVAARLGGESADDQFQSWMAARADKTFNLAEQRLSQVPYFAGESFTVADIMMVFPMTTMRAFTKRSLSAFPSIRTYLGRIGARPAYRAAMQAGDPAMRPMLD